MNPRAVVAVVGVLVGVAMLRAQESALSGILLRDDGPALAKLLRSQPEARDRKIESGWPPLNVAAARGSLACVRELLAAKAPVDSLDAQGRTPAQRAADGGHGAIARLLREHGARLDLEVAMVAGDEAWVKQWLADHRDDVPWIAQMRAAQAGATATLKLVLPRAAPRPDVEFGAPMPGLAFFAIAHADTLAMLFDAGEPIDERFGGKWGFSGSTLLHAAAQRDCGASVDLLLARGMPVDEPDEHGGTALQAALATGAVQAVATLLGKGASLARGSEFLGEVCGKIKRGLAADELERLRRCAHLLLQHRVPMDIGAALALARHADLRRLVAAAPESLRTTRPEPWLVRAAKCTDAEAMRILLEAGADIAAADAVGYTALHWAAFWGAADCADLLLGRGAPVSPRAARAITPLHEAVRLGHPEVARLLLRAGADRDAKDEDGLRPIDHAGGLRAQFEAVFAAKD